MKLAINSHIQTKAPQLKLLVTELSFSYEAKRESTWQTLLTPLIQEIEQEDQIETIRENPTILATKSTYKQFGKDPARFRPSSESLWRRIVQKKGLYQINSLVDLNNYFSLLYKIPFGVYDLDKLSPPIELTLGTAGMSYAGIGKAAINLEGALVLEDQLGPFGGPTSDSLRGMINPQTKHALLIGYSFESTPVHLHSIQADIAEKVGDYLLNGQLIAQHIV